MRLGSTGLGRFVLGRASRTTATTPDAGTPVSIRGASTEYMPLVLRVMEYRQWP